MESDPKTNRKKAFFLEYRLERSFGNIHFGSSIAVAPLLVGWVDAKKTDVFFTHNLIYFHNSSAMIAWIAIALRASRSIAPRTKYQTLR